MDAPSPTNKFTNKKQYNKTTATSCNDFATATFFVFGCVIICHYLKSLAKPTICPIMRSLFMSSCLINFVL